MAADEAISTDDTVAADEVVSADDTVSAEDAAVERAQRGDEGAVAALMTLLLAMRASEIVTRVVRDVDDYVTDKGEVKEGGLLWITRAKTPAGGRHLVVPEVLRQFLLTLSADKLPHTPLFATSRSKSGLHDRDWPRAQVQRICELVGVPSVCAHAMRGLHSTLAMDAGITAPVVAGTLGHADERVTARSYSLSNEPERAKQRKELKVLKGGRK